jgi:arylsulfatase A-like enzyme
MRVAITALVAVALSSWSPTSFAAADKPLNVLFIVSDDLNCDLHCYGHDELQTPNIDALAARGVLFERAYCQFPLCSPSRSSFLTGRRPNVTRIHTNAGAGRTPAAYDAHPHFRDYIPDTVTLPQLFRDNGYFVARVGKLYHYGVPGQVGTPGLDDPPSWTLAVNPAGRDKAEEHKIFTLTPGSYGGTLSWYAAEGLDVEQTDGLSATAAISLLEAHQEGPFFLAVGFYRPHTPYVAPRSYFEHYPPDGIALPALSEDDRSRTPPAAYQSAKKEQEGMSDDLRRQAIQAYHASISFMDAQVGRVIEALDRLGLSDNTVIVMTSDHGYHMADHGLWQKMSLFENSAHVPLIIVAPGAAGNGNSTPALAELVDLYPTLADLCDLTPPDYLDGVSLKPVLDDPRESVKDAAFTQVRRGENKHGYSIRTDRFRFTMWNNGEDGLQLFDLETDPQETRNLAADAEYADAVAELSGRLREYAAGQ